MSRINIYRGTFLEKEELTRMFSFLTENNSVAAVLSASGSYGIVSPEADRGNVLRVSISSAGNSIDIAPGYIISPDNKSYYTNQISFFPIPDDGKFYWVKASAFERNYEDGLVQVDVNGNVSGNVSFLGVVRGQSSGVPTCIRFIRTDGGELANDKVYQVVDVIDNNNIILSGGYTFTPETNLSVIVLGSIPMGRRFTAEQLEGLYLFTGISITLVEETALNVQPDKASGEYYLARVQNNRGQIFLEDKRAEFWTIGDGVLPPYQTFDVLEEDYDGPYNPDED